MNYEWSAIQRINAVNAYRGRLPDESCDRWRGRQLIVAAIRAQMRSQQPRLAHNVLRTLRCILVRARECGIPFEDQDALTALGMIDAYVPLCDPCTFDDPACRFAHGIGTRLANEVTLFDAAASRPFLAIVAATSNSHGGTTWYVRTPRQMTTDSARYSYKLP